MASLIQQAVEYVKETFSASTSISGPATADRISTNPLEKSIENLNGRYSLGQTEVGEYIKFGINDDYPIILDRMLRQSPVHSGIITKKAKMVSGKGITYDFENVKTPAKQAEIKAFLANCAGKSQGFYDQIVHSAFENEHKGAIAIYVKWNAEHNKPIELRSLDIKGVRAAKPKDGKVTHYIVRRRFGPNALSMQDNEPRLIPALISSLNTERKFSTLRTHTPVTSSTGFQTTFLRTTLLLPTLSSVSTSNTPLRTALLQRYWLPSLVAI